MLKWAKPSRFRGKDPNASRQGKSLPVEMQFLPASLSGVLLWTSVIRMSGAEVRPEPVPTQGTQGLASWYGEAHRGKLMANGRRFDPDKLTAASWSYPLGTRIRVSVQSQPQRNIIVTITDRGPAASLVERGRIIDLSHAAFRVLEKPGKGLVRVKLQRAN